jgi:hypothetical protein
MAAHVRLGTDAQGGSSSYELSVGAALRRTLAEGSGADGGRQHRAAHGQANLAIGLPSVDNLNCDANIKNQIDFTSLTPSSAVIADDVRRLIIAAASDPTKAFDRLLGAVKIIDYRRFQGEEVVNEELGLVRALSYLISKQEQVVNESFLSRLRELSNTWCAHGANLLLLVLGDPATRQRAERESADQVLSFDISKQGDLLSSQQESALNSLAAAAQAKPLSPAAIEDIVHIIENDNRGVEGVPRIVDWLRRIAAYQVLPRSTVAFLQKELRRPAGEFDFHQLVAFEILARNGQHLPQDAIAELVNWSRSNAANNLFVSEYAEGLGFLGLVTNLGQEPASALAARLVPEIPIPLKPDEITGRGDLIIRSDDFKHGVALGRLAQGMPLPGPIVDKLSRFASARRGIADYDQVILGLAVQRFRGTNLRDIRNRFAVNRSDAQQRAFDVDLATTIVLKADSNNRQATLDFLRASWAAESEPEVKIALGELIAKSTLRLLGMRLSDPPVCKCGNRDWTIGSSEDDTGP